MHHNKNRNVDIQKKQLIKEIQIIIQEGKDNLCDVKKVCEINNEIPSNIVLLTREIYMIELMKHSKYMYLLDQEIYNMIKNMRETSKYLLINYVFWTKTNNYEEIIKAVEVLIQMGYNALDTSNDNELVLQSLILSRENGRLNDLIFNKCYQMLTNPSNESAISIIVNILNKISILNYKLFSEGICWLLNTNMDLFVEYLFINFLMTLKISRNENGIYNNIYSLLDMIFKIIEEGPKSQSNFELFYQKNNWDSKNIYLKFNDSLFDYILNTFNKEKNIGVYGAVLGLLDYSLTFKIIDYCKTISVNYPDILLNYISHSRNLEYGPISILLQICTDIQTKKSHLKLNSYFTILDDLKLFFNTENFEIITNLSQKNKYVEKCKYKFTKKNIQIKEINKYNKFPNKYNSKKNNFKSEKKINYEEKNKTSIAKKNASNTFELLEEESN
jgi:hypothetical protein